MSPAYRVACLVLLSCLPAAAQEAGPDALAQDQEALNAAAGAPVRLTRSPQTGFAAFMSTERGRPVPVPGAAGTAEGRARSFLATHGATFGVKDADALTTTRVRVKDETGMDHVRLRQTIGGVPVAGGELMIHLKDAAVVAVNARALPEPEDADTRTAVDASEAVRTASVVLEKHLGITDATFTDARLEWLNRGFLGGAPGPTRLAWFFEARRDGVREYFWVDAKLGHVLLHFNQQPDAKNRRIHNGNSGPSLPGTLVRSEGQAATGDSDADNAYLYFGDTYDYYLAQHARDSYDGAGAQLIGTVHSCPAGFSCPMQNAFWNGTQMVFGDGFAAADDVVAHELTHAVTQSEADLFGYMQSGALNESFSDIFGETVDQTNGHGTDTTAVKWKLGEDVPGFGAVRDMKDPTNFDDPGKMSDSQFACINPLEPGGDAGGIHSNNGLPNHAYALMVDGGSYNGQTITGIGLTKAAKIEYRTLTQYLLSGSDFLDAYNSVKQACTDLIGAAGITAGDCTNVGKALDAVEMASPWHCTPTQPSVPALCPVGTPSTLFSDNLEGGGGNWTASTTLGSNVWFLGNFFATSGVLHLYGQDPPVTTDSRLSMTNAVAIPSVGGARMQFNHSYGFEYFGITYFDGGVLEYSANNGGFVDARPLIVAGANYGPRLISTGTNPLRDKRAFTGDSFGYTATQLDLSSLAGKTVKFRFRVGADVNTDDFGWFIDDVRIYQCIVPVTISIDDVSVTEGDSGTKNATFTVSLSAPSSQAVAVSFATLDFSANAPGVYTSKTGSLSFDPGVTSKTIKVSIVGDPDIESNESFFVNLFGEAGATIADAQGKGTIVNDDVAPPDVTVTDVAVSEGGPGATTNAKFAVKLSQASTKTVTVNWATADGTATTADNDYTGAAGALTFDPGVTSKNAKVTVKGDSKPEPTESFFVNLTGATNASILDNQAVGTITSDDAPPPLTISINDVSVSEGNTGTTTATLTVSLSTTSGSPVTVDFETADDSATTADSDYDVASGTVTFGIGVTSQPVVVTVHGDATIEPNQSFLVNLSNASPGATIADGQGRGTILDDDNPIPDLIFADGFESGALGAWSQAVTDAGDLSASTRSALAGGFGMEAKLNDSHALYVQDDLPSDEGRYRARLLIDPNTFAVGADGDKLTFFEAADASTGRVVALVVRKSGGAYQVRAEVSLEGGSTAKTNFLTISDAPHALEIDWQAAASSSSNDGRLEFWIDGASQAALSALDSDGHVDLARLGVVTAPAGISGRLHFDDFVAHRATYIGP